MQYVGGFHHGFNRSKLLKFFFEVDLTIFSPSSAGQDRTCHSTLIPS